MKILFVMPSMMARGTQRSLISLLKHTELKQHDVSLVLADVSGDLLDELPPEIKVLSMGVDDRTTDMVNNRCKTGTRTLLKEAFLKHDVSLVASILFDKVIKRDPSVNYLPAIRSIPMYNEEVDVAVCYHMHSQLALRYVAEKVKAKKKIAWIHNDFYGSGFDKYINGLKRYLKEYDLFMGVSKRIVEEFSGLFPEYAEKTHIFYNYIPTEEILMKGDDYYPPEYQEEEEEKRWILLSVGSLTDEKGFDIAIKSASLLKDEGIRFKWFIIGEGDERSELETMIAENDLCEYVMLPGARSNPYPYFAGCDIYVLTSRHEGCCIAIDEAMTFKKPVIATDVSGVREQLEDGKYGLITGMDPIEIKTAIMKMMSDDPCRENIIKTYSKCRPVRERPIGLLLDGDK